MGMLNFILSTIHYHKVSCCVQTTEKQNQKTSGGDDNLRETKDQINKSKIFQNVLSCLVFFLLSSFVP